MALIDIRCDNDHITEVHRSIHDWPSTPPCPECGAPTTQTHLPRQTQWTPDPVIVFRAPDGTFRFPGDANGTSAHHYAANGYERIELRGAHDVRRFESVMNKHEYSRAQRRVEARQRQREERESRMRSELRHQMQQFSERGRDLARAAMRTNDNKPRERAADPNFHAEVYSFNRSNRDDSRDAQGRRRRD